jgi:hypothetical protein
VVNAKEIFIAAQLGLKAVEEIAYAYFQRSYVKMAFFGVLLALTFRRGLALRFPKQSAAAAQRND